MTPDNAVYQEIGRKMADAWNRAVDRMEREAEQEGACPSCGYSIGTHPDICDSCHEHVDG